MTTAAGTATIHVVEEAFTATCALLKRLPGGPEHRVADWAKAHLRLALCDLLIAERLGAKAGRFTATELQQAS